MKFDFETNEIRQVSKKICKYRFDFFWDNKVMPKESQRYSTMRIGVMIVEIRSCIPRGNILYQLNRRVLEKLSMIIGTFGIVFDQYM